MKTPIRVLHVTAGPVSRSLESLARAADRRCLQQAIVTLSSNDPGHLDGIPVIRRAGKSNLRSALWLRQALLDFDPQIIHLHDTVPLHAWGLCARWRAALVHTCSPNYGNGTGVGAWLRSRCFGAKTTCVSSGRRGMPGALHIPAGIFVRHRELFSGRQCWRQRHGFVEEDFLMGAFVSPRDLDRLLRAFAPVAASGAKLLVFSPFPPDAAARAEALGLANLVRFLEGPAEMSALDAVVVVSAGEEFVFRTMEAMAAARACVATAPHPIEDNRSGLLVNADADSVAEALARLVDSPHLCVRLGYAAREQALAEFDERKTVRAYEALYRRLLLAQAAAAAA